MNNENSTSPTDRPTRYREAWKNMDVVELERLDRERRNHESRVRRLAAKRDLKLRKEGDDRYWFESTIGIKQQIHSWNDGTHMGTLEEAEAYLNKEGDAK